MPGCVGRWGVTYLVGCYLLLATYAGYGQSPGLAEGPMPWYQPKEYIRTPSPNPYQVVAYESLADLAEKLAKQPSRPYHLSLQVGKADPTNWQALRTIPPATHLTLQLADSVANCDSIKSHGKPMS